jgi:hypothetical protein
MSRGIIKVNVVGFVLVAASTLDRTTPRHGMVSTYPRRSSVRVDLALHANRGSTRRPTPRTWCSALPFRLAAA